MGFMVCASQVYAFSFSDVLQKAQERAQKRYQPQIAKVDKAFQQLNFSTFHAIKPNPAQALWSDTKSPFKVSFYPVGMHFDRYVNIYSVTPTAIQPLRYDPKYFIFPSSAKTLAAKSQQAFAGFRIHYPVNGAEFPFDELASFLGASYFRMIGQQQVYGSSARALAMDTALPTGEEFPYFTDYWLVRPAPQDRHLVVYAILDAPRLTGAFEFIIRPGKNTVVEVRSRVFARETVQKLGIAPLTSMFFYGVNQPPVIPELRPEIHDADGLSILKDTQESIWRPLRNPKRLALSRFYVTGLKGFGLLQRGREFARYEDLQDLYHQRPSVWVEPRGSWGKGVVELVEIPSPDETNDNIVAYWIPEQPLPKGKTYDASYVLHWTLAAEFPNRPIKLAQVTQTIVRPAEVRNPNLVRRKESAVAFYIDFSFPATTQPNGKLVPFDPTKAQFTVQPQVHVSSQAQLQSVTVVPNPARAGYRMHLVVSVRDPKTPVELSAQLLRQGALVSETWNYQYRGSDQ